MPGSSSSKIGTTAVLLELISTGPDNQKSTPNPIAGANAILNRLTAVALGLVCSCTCPLRGMPDRF
jgi:hypothetical protein